MGRHSSPEQWPFYRSVVAWFLPWVLIAAVAGTAVFIAIDALGQGDLDTPSPLAQASSEPTTTTTLPEPSPTPVEVTTPDPSPSPSKKPEPEETKPELITQGVTAQVLNATSDAGAGATMADRLAKLGYQVVAVDTASTNYDETTVFWSTNEGRPAAEALAEKFGWASGPKPDNLSSTVTIHVVVGRDEA